MDCFYKTRRREKSEVLESISGKNINVEAPSGLSGEAIYHAKDLPIPPDVYKCHYYDSVIEDVVVDVEKLNEGRPPNLPRLRCPPPGYKPVMHTTETAMLKGLLRFTSHEQPLTSRPGRSVYACYADVPTKIFNDPKYYLSQHVSLTERTPTNADIRRAFSRLEPSTSNLLPGFSLVNFIHELKDFKRLLGLGRKRAHESAVDYGANTHLGVNFGAIPFVSDVLTAFTMMDTIDAYILKWNDFAKKGKIMDFHQPFFKTEEDSVPVHIPNLRDGIYTWSFDGEVSTQTKAVASLYIRPIALPDDIRMKLRYRALGLDSPLEIIWEAIPYSWAADYFLNIQGLLRAFERPESLFKFDIIDAGYSVTTTVDGTAVSTCSQPELCAPTVSVAAKTYRRTPVPGSIVNDIYISGEDPLVSISAPDAKQLSLLASVAWANRQ